MGLVARLNNLDWKGFYRPTAWKIAAMLLILALAAGTALLAVGRTVECMMMLGCSSSSLEWTLVGLVVLVLFWPMVLAASAWALAGVLPVAGMVLGTVPVAGMVLGTAIVAIILLLYWYTLACLLVWLVANRSSVWRFVGELRVADWGSFFRPTRWKIILTLVLPFYLTYSAQRGRYTPPIYYGAVSHIPVPLLLWYAVNIIMLFSARRHPLWSASEKTLLFFLDHLLPLLVNYLLACALIHVYERLKARKARSEPEPPKPKCAKPAAKKSARTNPRQ